MEIFAVKLCVWMVLLSGLLCLIIAIQHIYLFIFKKIWIRHHRKRRNNFKYKFKTTIREKLKNIFMNWYLYDNIEYQEFPLSLFHPPSYKKLEKISISIDELIKDIKLNIIKVPTNTGDGMTIEGLCISSRLKPGEYLRDDIEDIKDETIKKIFFRTLRISLYLCFPFLEEPIETVKIMITEMIKKRIERSLLEKEWSHSYIRNDINRVINIQQIEYYTKPIVYLNKIKRIFKLSHKPPRRVKHIIKITYFFKLDGY